MISSIVGGVQRRVSTASTWSSRSTGKIADPNAPQKQLVDDAIVVLFLPHKPYSDKSKLFRLLHSVVPTLKRFLFIMKLMLGPKAYLHHMSPLLLDHHVSFKRCLFLSRSGAQAKEHVMALAEIWVVATAILVGLQVSFYGYYNPNNVLDPTPFVKLAAEIFLFVGVWCTFATMILFVVLFINFSACGAANFKAFFALAIFPIQLAEYVLNGALYSFEIFLVIFVNVRIWECLSVCDAYEKVEIPVVVSRVIGGSNKNSLRYEDGAPANRRTTEVVSSTHCKYGVGTGRL